MSKRAIIISAIAAVFVFTIVIFFLTRKSFNTYEQSGAFNAVPETSPAILRINNPVKFFETLPDNEMVSLLMASQPANTLMLKIFEAFDYLSEFDDFKRLINKNEVLISLNYSGRNDVDPLVIIPVKSKSEADMFSKVVNKIKSNSEIASSIRKYDRVDIYNFQINGQSVYAAYYQGACFISEKTLLIENAIRQSKLNSIAENPQLESILKTTSAQADINFFINPQNAGALFSGFLSSSMNVKAGQLKNYSGWTELDISISEGKILMNGFSAAGDSDNYFAETIINQQAVSSDIARILPQSTAFYTALFLSDIKAYVSDYETYLQRRNLSIQKQNKIQQIERETGIGIYDFMYEIADQQFALAGINTNQNTPTSGRIWVVKAKSGSHALNKLTDLQKKYIGTKELKPDEWSRNYSIDAQTLFKVYRFPYADLPETVFGKIFSGVQANWFSVYDNYIIFGDSYRTVASALHANVLGETLSGSMDYNRFSSNFNDKSNITFYVNTAVSMPVAAAFFNQTTSEVLNSNEDLRKFKAFVFQVTSTRTMLYNNSCLLFNPEIQSKPQTIWQSKIGRSFDFKPKFVINHYDKQNREIVLQDNDNIFYLINNVGRVLWQINLDSPIMGEVHQIDLYKNGKLQYLFNTENKIYLVDRNGDHVKNYPVNLRAKASNGIAVFDYNNNLDYRFFVACTDCNIYAYSSDGNMLRGWNLFKTDHPVTKPVQHFRVDGKDYIVASDIMKDYILHRRGTIRVKTDAVYPHSENNTLYLEDRSGLNEPRIVTTDKTGNMRYTSLENGSHQIVNVSKFSEQHYFLSHNLTSDEGYEYIFADKNYVYVCKSGSKLMLKKEFDKSITHSPNIYTFSGGVKKIGVTCKDENQIYLFDTKGQMHQGFPLAGSTEFSIGFISAEMSNFNLLVGSPDGYLYNYYVE